MTRPSALTQPQIEAALADLNSGAQAAWELRDGKLTRTFLFADFVEAFGFMTQAAMVAERMDHHPEWSNVYLKVEVALVTHDAGGITELDVELARRMEALLG